MADQQPHKAHHKSKEKKQRDPATQNPKAHAFANPGRFQKQYARSHDIKEKRLHVPLVDRLPEEAPPLVVGLVGPPGVGKTTLLKSLIRRYTKQTLSAPTGPLTVVTGKRRRLTFIECPSDSLPSMIDTAKIVDIVLLMIDGNYGFEMETMEFLNVLSSSGMPGNVFGILTHLDMFKKQDTLRTRKKQLKHRFWSELYQGAKLFYLSGVVNGRYPDREVLNISRFLSVMKNPRPLVWRNSHPYALADRYLDLTPPMDIERNPKCDRTVALYGYVRGTNFPAQGAKVHIPGLGDVDVSNIEGLPDPCPTPHMNQAMAEATGKSPRRKLGEKQKVLYAPMSDVGGVLVDKDAVYIDVKKPTFDLENEEAAERGFGEQMVMGLQGDRRLLGQAESRVRLFGNQEYVTDLDNEETKGKRVRRPAGRSSHLENGDPSLPDDEAYVSASFSESDEDNLEEAVAASASNSRFNRSSDAQDVTDFDQEDHDVKDVAFAGSDDDIGSLLSADSDGEADDFDDSEKESGDEFDANSSVDDAPAWKSNLAAKAAAAMHAKRKPRQTKDLARLIYDDSLTPRQAIDRWNGLEDTTSKPTEVDGEDDNFFRQRQSNEDNENDATFTMPRLATSELEAKWTDDANIARLRSRFTSSHGSKHDKGDASDLDENDEDEDFAGLEDEDEDDSDEGDGEFEDLEGEPTSAPSTKPEQQSLEAERAANARKKEQLKQRFEEEDREGFANPKHTSNTTNATTDPSNAPPSFGEDDWYDAQKAQIQTQLDINRAEFSSLPDDRTRTSIEGFRAGTYARLTLTSVPYEFCANFHPRHPLIIGGLTPTENRFGYLSVRIKRHRWHSRILKSNDPLTFSLGWRRFQSIPLYSLSDSRTRNRLLKYTPEHMHCFGTFWGPLAAPNTGFCAVQTFSNAAPGFRIAASGVVLSVDQSTQIVKKLKLKGYPHKIYKNTAIIRDMFASDLEVAKFQAGNLRTVSGIRGMVKGRAGKQFPEGYVRAGFEDKILKSDIVFLSAWRTVNPREFYMPVTNLLDMPAINGGGAAAGKKPPTSSTATTTIINANREAPTTVDPNSNPNKTNTTNNTTTTDPQTWTGMRTTSHVRHALSLPPPTSQNPNSTYGPAPHRPERHFHPLRIPRTLASSLPFASLPTKMRPQRRETYLSKRAVLAPTGEERRTKDLVQMLATVRGEKVEKRRGKQEERKEGYRREKERGLGLKAEREKRERDAFWRREGRKRKMQEGGEDGGGRGRGGGRGKRMKKS